jgi:hypothetical protein
MAWRRRERQPDLAESSNAEGSRPAASSSPDPVQPGRDASMLPRRRERPALESAFVRMVATGGVIGVGVALGAILTSQAVEGWIVGLVVAVVSVTLSAILWSSRRL